MSAQSNILLAVSVCGIGFATAAAVRISLNPPLGPVTRTALNDGCERERARIERVCSLAGERLVDPPEWCQETQEMLAEKALRDRCFSQWEAHLNVLRGR